MSRGTANLQLVGLLLLVGAAITLGLHALEAPESLYRWLYHHLLSGLDVPEEPSQGTVDLISYVSLIGGLLELIAGLAVLAIDRFREASSQVG
jgi:multisubunit Na+/H+ antiporter MnhB subunit